MSVPITESSVSMRNAAGSAIAASALIVLTLANMLPFLHIWELGEDRPYTILGGVCDLFDRHDRLLGFTIFVFSFLFPFTKLLMLLPVAFPVLKLPCQARRRLLASARWLAKYSMLDVFVIAVFIVVVKTENSPMLEGMMKVQIGQGLFWFLAAWLLSATAGLLMTAPQESHCPNSMPLTPRIPKTRTPHGKWLLVVVGLLQVAVGVVLVLCSPSAEEVANVRAIRLSEKPRVDIGLLPKHTADMYLEVQTSSSLMRTKIYHKAVLGNGLTIVLPTTVPFREIRTISAWDARDSTLWDRLHNPQQLDRVDELHLTTPGAVFYFKVVTTDEVSFARWVPIIFGSVLASAGLICMVWYAVVRSEAGLVRNPQTKVDLSPGGRPD